MANLRLQPPEVYERENSVFICIKHEPLASVEATIMKYLANHESITNKIARQETGIQSEGTIKEAFYRLKDRHLIESVIGRSKKTAAWCKVGTQDENLENENSLYEMYPQYEQLVIDNLKINQVITNSIAREILKVDSQTARNIFKRLQKRKLIEIVPGTSRGGAMWRKSQDSDV